GPAMAIADLFASHFASPEEALRFLPETLAGATGFESDPAAVAEVDEAASDVVEPPGRPAVAKSAPAPGSVGEVVGAAFHTAGVSPVEFGQAFSGALEDGLGSTAATDPERAPLLRELFAAGAVVAEATPEGAAAVEEYLARHKDDPEARRWGARVRTL